MTLGHEREDHVSIPASRQKVVSRENSGMSARAPPDASQTGLQQVDGDDAPSEMCDYTRTHIASVPSPVLFCSSIVVSAASGQQSSGEKASTHGGETNVIHDKRLEGGSCHLGCRSEGEDELAEGM